MNYPDDKVNNTQYAYATENYSATTNRVGPAERISGQFSIRSLSWIHTGATLLYALSGAAMIAASIIFNRLVLQNTNNSSLNAALTLALKPVSLNGGLVAGAVIQATVLVTVGGTIRQSRALLKLSFILNVLSILLTLAFGLSVWFKTMIERSEYFILWQSQPVESTAMLQDRFNCCGYFDFSRPTFTTSKACPNTASAAARQGCFLPFTNFADFLLRRIFTTVFGLSGTALLSLLTGLVLMKRMIELERFRRIDLKRRGLPVY